MRGCSLVALAFALAAARDLSAQRCVGRASFRSGPVDVGGGAVRTNNATQLDARVAVGNSVGLFGAVTLASIAYDNSGQGANLVGLDAGYAIAVDAANRLSFCPLAGASYRQGPKVEELQGFVDVTERVISLGASLGTTWAASSSLDVVPFLSGVYYVHSPSVNSTGQVERGTYSYMRLDLGTGVIFHDNVTVRPVVAIPIDSKQVRTSYGLSVSVNFGGQ